MAALTNRAAFQNRRRLQDECRNNYDRVLDALESVLDAEALAAVEAAILPPPTDAARAEALETAKATLADLGEDALATAVEARITEIAEAKVPGKVPGVDEGIRDPGDGVPKGGPDRG